MAGGAVGLCDRSRDPEPVVCRLDKASDAVDAEHAVLASEGASGDGADVFRAIRVFGARVWRGDGASGAGAGVIRVGCFVAGAASGGGGMGDGEGQARGQRGVDVSVTGSDGVLLLGGELRKLSHRLARPGVSVGGGGTHGAGRIGKSALRIGLVQFRQEHGFVRKYGEFASVGREGDGASDSWLRIELQRGNDVAVS